MSLFQKNVKDMLGQSSKIGNTHGSFHVKTAHGSHSTLLDFAETSSKWVFR